MNIFKRRPPAPPAKPAPTPPTRKVEECRDEFGFSGPSGGGQYTCF